MYYNTERRLVYLAHPHTASRSTCAMLQGRGFVKESRENHHAKLYENGIVTPENRSEWAVFTTVRNHFDWILAHVWKMHLATQKAPKIDWTDLRMWKAKLQHRFITQHTLFGRHCPDADRVLRFENLKAGLTDTVGAVRRLARVGLNPQRSERDYREFYTPEVRRWVEDRFGDEMEQLGYSFGSEA